MEEALGRIDGEGRRLLGVEGTQSLEGVSPGLFKVRVGRDDLNQVGLLPKEVVNRAEEACGEAASS
jgi:hypothetical protein